MNRHWFTHTLYAAAGLLAACSTGPSSDRQAKRETGRPKVQDTQAADEDPASSGDDEDGDGPAFVIDDANRFVEEDLERFMKAHPAALRKEDVELFERCVGKGCLNHGVSDSIGPFLGPSVRYLVPLWLRGCLSGSAEACLLAGRTYQGSSLSSQSEGQIHEGYTDEELRGRFRQYIERACLLDDRQCEQWADHTLGDPSPPAADVTRAVAVLKAGCERKDHGSCAALGRHAGDYPAIGDDIRWWRAACSVEPGAPGHSCSRYASRLLERNESGDREAAVAALGDLCEPGSASWTRECKGDAQLGEESCPSTILMTRGQACLRLAPTLPDATALRINAALCVGSLLDEVNELGAQACDEASGLAKKLGKPKAFLAAIARRRCEVDEMTCLSTTYDLRACEKARSACERGAGG